MSNKLTNYPETVVDLPLNDYFALLLENTDKAGNLYIPDEESACALKDSDDVFHLTMNWDKASVNMLLEELDALKKAFKEIAKVNPEIDGNEATAKKLLSAENFSLWNTYIKSFGAAGFDTDMISTIYNKDFEDEPLTTEEENIWEDYKKALHEESAKRLGKELNAYFVIIHALRYERLLEMGVAPEIVMDNEFRLFALNLAIHRFASSKETEIV